MRIGRSNRSLIRTWVLITIVIFPLSWLWFSRKITTPEIKDDNLVSKQAPQETQTIQQMENKSDRELTDTAPLSYKTITFYYPWYGNPTVNGKWHHWNHKVLIDNGKEYTPPDSIGANFYPLLGPYSSTDSVVIEQHMSWMATSRIGILCTSWWGRSASDGQLEHSKGYTDQLIPLLLDIAHKYKIKVCFHLEPYKGRSPDTVKEDLKYISENYGKHAALFRDPQHGNRPIIFVYDSYLTTADDWSVILDVESPYTIRNTNHDAIMIALYVQTTDQSLIAAGFDGFYTYFATDGFTQGSSTVQWRHMSQWAAENNKLFIPSVGPGYDDTRIRPWNPQNRRDREDGKYYDRMWERALEVNPYMISITSFNEWHEGTQIEPSVPKEITGYRYLDFLPNEPDFYLKRTKVWIDKWD